VGIYDCDDTAGESEADSDELDETVGDGSDYTLTSIRRIHNDLWKLDISEELKA
jgi:hypothetical protein